VLANKLAVKFAKVQHAFLVFDSDHSGSVRINVVWINSICTICVSVDSTHVHCPLVWFADITRRVPLCFGQHRLAYE